MLCSVLHSSFAYAAPREAPIIGGSGAYKFQYMPQLLQPPPSSSLLTGSDAHGLVTDAQKNIYLTYVGDEGKDANCLIRWKPDGTGGEFVSTGNVSKLCSGTPHGLTISAEGGKEYLYHANNAGLLTKTTLEGEIVWQRTGNFGQDPKAPYRPTWFGVPPAERSKFIYLCDGYGSNNVYVFDRGTGAFMNKVYGGKGGRDQHGKFSTNHGCLYDERFDKIAGARAFAHDCGRLRCHPLARVRFHFRRYRAHTASKPPCHRAPRSERPRQLAHRVLRLRRRRRLELQLHGRRAAPNGRGHAAVHAALVPAARRARIDARPFRADRDPRRDQ